MRTFKTKKGTELPISDIKGKDYLLVAHRIVWFREEHPEWSILTESVVFNEKQAVFKATIVNEKGNIVATAHKQEDPRGFGDYMEKAETGAVGRALALVGYGTQFAPDLDEGDRLADSPIVNKEGSGYRAPISAAYDSFVARQEVVDSIKDEDWIIPFGKKYKGVALGVMSDDEIASMIAFFHKDGKPLSGNALEFEERGNRLIQKRRAESK
jgi:hypothetical protein